jgi:hypothetical protein
MVKQQTSDHVGAISKVLERLVALRASANVSNAAGGSG